MAIITLTSDWNRSDFYVGAVKGRLLSLLPNVTIVDISHQIQAFNFSQAAFVLKGCYKFYPEGTIHVVDVCTEGDEKTPYVAIKAQGQYFVGADNGIFSLLLEDIAMEQAVDIPVKPEMLGSFQGLNILVPIAVAIAKGTPLQHIGTQKLTLTRTVPILPIVEEDYIGGHIVYVDSYFNAISNVSREVFEETRNGRDFVIHVQSKQNEIRTISTNYSSAPNGDLIGLFNSLDLLEIAIVKGYTAELLNLDSNSTLRISFFNKQE